MIAVPIQIWFKEQIKRDLYSFGFWALIVVPKNKHDFLHTIIQSPYYLKEVKSSNITSSCGLGIGHLIANYGCFGVWAISIGQCSQKLSMWGIPKKSNQNEAEQCWVLCWKKSLNGHESCFFHGLRCEMAHETVGDEIPTLGTAFYCSPNLTKKRIHFYAPLAC